MSIIHFSEVSQFLLKNDAVNAGFEVLTKETRRRFYPEDRILQSGKYLTRGLMSSK
jgi:hypothetical protein